MKGHYAAPKAHTELRQGMWVNYYPRDGSEPKRGQITSWNDQWVFVRFGEPGTTSNACHRASLGLPGSTKRLR